MKALGLVVSEKKIFKSFPIYFNVKTVDPWGGAIFDPRGILSTIYVENLYMLPYNKFKISWPMVSKKKIFKSFPIYSM